ncbi:RNA-guided endonuclease TnpB family protein [Leptotrichia wadei]|uniref:Putative transposase n=1 Tax=Leptotrichia wadei TaxID=157687 RepID=A0A510KGF6_9FUSO|nr:RNA-guided endonuclease TnpB family protein [Leptotrichia wadei]BBM50760.1 putative transposase [Leptotrichia wadei]
MKYNLAFKYRIYPNKEQELLINKTFGCVRFVYNTILYTANKIYEEIGKNKIITPASLKSENQFLKEVDSLALSNAQLNVKRSFTNFFQKRAKFPRFKSKKNNVKSYTTNCVNNSIRIEENKYLILPKLKRVKLKYHREITEDYKIKSVTLTNSNGNYYVSVLTEFEKEIQKKPSNDKVIGLDFSMSELFVSSENQRADYPRYFRMLEKKLKKLQKSLSRKVKFSKNWYKQKMKISKLHKLSKKLSEVYNAVVVEDLNMRGMSQALNFGKSIGDNGWGMFLRMVEYKLMFLGKQFLKIDKWFPSSKTCSRCGNVKEELKLSERSYKCECCGIEIDRDYNAALNIRGVGKEMLKY